MTNKSIAETVRNLLQQVNVESPPVPVERIARIYGVQLRYEPFEGQISGILAKENSRIIVGVNALHSKARQRFTIAHEIGHLVLHTGDQFHIDRDFRTILLRDEKSSQGTDLKEIQANSFAAELLMPENMIRNDWEGHDNEFDYDYESDEFIKGLAKRYKVSLQAMIFRLIRLGIIKQEP